MADMKVRVKATSAGPAKTIVKARQFEIIVDEPENLGGTDTAANPVEYVLAAFSGCLNVMAHLIANEMQFELRGVEIDLCGDLNPARLFGQSYAERAGYKQIDVTIKADADADDETLKKWVAAIEDRCPVSDNLLNATPIKISCEKK